MKRHTRIYYKKIFFYIILNLKKINWYNTLLLFCVCVCGHIDIIIHIFSLFSQTDDILIYSDGTQFTYWLYCPFISSTTKLSIYTDNSGYLLFCFFLFLLLDSFKKASGERQKSQNLRLYSQMKCKLTQELRCSLKRAISL